MARKPIRYGVYTHSTGEPLDAVEMHVLARAYCAAWRCMFMREPVGRHVLRPLDILFEFAETGRRQTAKPE